MSQKNEIKYQRGHAEPSDYSHCSLAEAGSAGGRVKELVGELSAALFQLEGLRSDLLDLQPLLHVLQPSPVVQEEVHVLCAEVAAVAGGSSLILAVFSGRARAAERRDARAQYR